MLLLVVSACNNTKTNDTADKPEKPDSYFTNPAPRFEVDLGEAASNLPTVEFTGDKLKRPVQFREWIFVGGRIAEGSEAAFESYYMHPRTFHAMKQDRAWPKHVVIARERSDVKAEGTDFLMGEPRRLEVAVFDVERFANKPEHWAFFDFGTRDAPASTASPDGRPWFEKPDELLAFCPVLREIKR